MSQTIHLAGISGSLRKDSYNTALLKNVEKLLLQDMMMEILPIGNLPLYNGDEDLPAVTQRPEPVERFREGLAKADGIIIVSPEYNYSIPGVLKNAIDWASRGEDSPLLNKPVAIMGASPGLMGTVRMQLAFLPVFQYLNMQVVYKPEIMLAQANKKFDDQKLLTDSFTQELIVKKLQALQQLIIENDER
jgi:chromate reductase